MHLSTLTAISPLDGRYHHQTQQLSSIVSEYGLIFYRLTVEINWLITLANCADIPEISPLSTEEKETLQLLIHRFDETAAQSIKTIEKKINHDVKAVEYYLREKLKSHDTLYRLIPFIHFACTSEDINNLAYGLMIKHTRDTIVAPQLNLLIQKIDSLAQQAAEFPMLSRTHGQPATPTTLGKEMKNFSVRLSRATKQFSHITITGKCNGAVGNYNAHRIAYPQVNWLSLSQQFVESLDLTWNEYTTQIEPHDQLAQLLNALSVCHTILIDFCRDIWGYLALDYFSQRLNQNEVGSSTMPHKINPIDFENTEGNLGIAIALASHMANKLPISRWQRDLTDSTVMRNFGSIFGYSLVAYQSLMKGIEKLSPDVEAMNHALNQHWEVLAEAVQTVMRRYGIEDAYEQLKIFTRGKKIDMHMLEKFIDEINIPENAKIKLKQLTPAHYLGYAVELAKKSL